MLKTLKSQLRLLIISFSIIATILVLAGFAHNKRNDEIRDITYELSEIEKLVYKDMEIVNSFLLFDVINEEFHVTTTSQNITSHKETYSKIVGKKGILEKINQQELKPKIVALFDKLSRIDQKFSELQKLELERGFKDYGLEGLMRKDIHWIEMNNSIPWFEMLMLRRHEKDYIIRQQDKYVNKHKLLISKLLEKENISRQSKRKLVFYRAKFERLVKLDNKIGKKGDNGLIKELKTTYAEIEFLLSDIIRLGKLKQNSMIESYKYAYISFAVVFIFISFIIGLYVSDRLSKQLHKLSIGISEFVSSKFTKIPELSHKGNKSEIHTLTKNFLILRDEIIDYIKSFKEKVKEQTQTLTFQNMQIENKNKKILAQKEKLYEQFQIILTQKERVSAQRRRLLESIKYAKHIQGALLPNSQTISRIYKNNFVLYKPKDIVSGDFYWFKKVETSYNNLSISIVADCTGHGVPGALLSMLGISYLNDIIINQKEYRPDVVLNRLRNNFINTLQQMENQHIINDGLDIAVCVIDNNTGILYYAGANRDIYIVRNNELNIIKGDRMPIGKHMNDSLLFTGSRIKLNDHDNIYMFTDGFADQFGGEKGAKFMRKRFRKLLLSVQNESFESQKKILNRHFIQWKGSNSQVDDILVVGFEFKKKHKTV